MGSIVNHRKATRFPRQGGGNSPGSGHAVLFLRAGRIAGVEVIPEGLSDEEAIARAHVLSAKRKGPFDSFEVWEGPRFVFRQPLFAEMPDADEPRAPSPSSNYATP